MIGAGRPLLVAAAALALAGCGGPSPAASPTPSVASVGALPGRTSTAICADLVLLGLRGQGQSPRAQAGVGAEVRGIVRATVPRLRGGRSVRLEAVRYSNGADATYDADVARGVRLVLARTSALHRRCPDTRVGLVGYSQGAQVAHLAAAAGSFSPVALLGDPLRAPRDHLATLAVGGRLTGRGNAGPGAVLPADRRAGVLEVCAAADNVCDAPPTGRVGAVSATHREIYETPRVARAAGARLAAVADAAPAR